MSTVDEIASQEKSEFRRWRRWFSCMFKRRYEKILMPLISWVFWTFFREERGNIFRNGIREFCWTFMCGWGFSFALHAAGTWWFGPIRRFMKR